MKVSKFLTNVLFLVLLLGWTACKTTQQIDNQSSATPSPTPTQFVPDIETIRETNARMAKATKDSSQYLKLVEQGDVDWVRDVIKMDKDKININERDKGNRSALIIAAKNSDVPMAKVLLENNIDLDLQDAFGSTALMHAIARRNKEFIEVLFTKNPNVNLKDGTGMSALTKAVGINEAELRNYIVKELIARKADVSIKAQNGWTLLQFAEPYPDTVKILKQAGAK